MADHTDELLAYAQDQRAVIMAHAVEFERRMRELAQQRDYALDLAVAFDDYCRAMEAFKRGDTADLPRLPRRLI